MSLGEEAGLGGPAAPCLWRATLSGVRRLLAFSATVLAGAACGLDVVGAHGEPKPGTETDAGQRDGSEPFDGGTWSDGGEDAADASPPLPGLVPPVIYAVTDEHVWTVDPTTGIWDDWPKGDSNCPVLDELALDRDGRLFGTGDGSTSLHRVYVEPSLSCQKVGSSADGYPRALTFAPRGTLDPNEEVLVGISGRTYVRIDTTTGAMTLIKANPLPSGWRAGDIANIGEKGYVLAHKGGAPLAESRLYEVDFATGDAAEAYPSFQYGRDLRGLAHWGGKLWAFGGATTVLLIDDEGNWTNAPPPPLPNGNPVGFKGAASSPLAPIK